VRLLCLVVGMLSLLWGDAAAGKISIEASVDRNVVGVGEELVLTVSVSGGLQNLPEPKLPDMPDFSVYGSGTNTSFSWTNGRISSSRTSTYVLVPRTEGKFTIPSISVEYGGKEYFTEPIEVTVTSAPQRSPRAPSAGGAQGGRSAPGRRGGGGRRWVLIEASLDRERAYVGEQVTLTIDLYSRARVVGSRLVPPSTTGFWVEELPGEKSFYKVVDGLQYRVTRVAMALFPTVEGTLGVGPVEWQCRVEEPLDWRDPFSLFPRTRDLSVESDSLSVEVLALPEEGRPDGYTGAVGCYGVSARVDKTEAKTGGPLTFTVTVSGVGNVNALADVQLPELPGFRSYDSGGSTDMKKDGWVVKGSRSFSRVYVPKVPGEFVFPPVSFAYFDPEAGRYRIAVSDSILFRVVPGEGAVAATTGGALMARDIRYIRTGSPSFSRIGDRLYKRRGFLLLQLLAPAMVLCAYAYRVAREKRADPAKSRARKARARARDAIQKAREMGRAGDPAGAWKGLASALRGYVADAAGASAAGLTADEMRAALAAMGADEKLAGGWMALLESCDAASFAPGGLTRAPSEDEVAEAVEMIDRLDALRRKKCKERPRTS